MREVINAKKNKYKRNCFEMVLQIQDLKSQIHENKIRSEMQLLTQEESPKFGKSHEKRGREKVRWAKRGQEEEGSDKENDLNYFPVRKGSAKRKLSNQPVNIITT